MKKHKPKWQGEVEGHAVNQILKFLPRLLPVYDLDDLYNEAFVVFLVCCRESKADNNLHFMAFFSICLRNRMIKLIEAMKKGKGNLSIENLDLDETLPLALNFLPEGELAVKVNRMPQQMLAQILSVIDSTKPKHARGAPVVTLRLAVERYLLS